mgnify:FL=1
MTIDDLFESLNIKYNNRELIENAFIHSSFVNENQTHLSDNERLEFMGDAVL